MTASRRKVPSSHMNLLFTRYPYLIRTGPYGLEQLTKHCKTK